MLHRDDYIKMLEKRASKFDGGKTGPTYDHDIDSAKVADEEHTKNLGDNRKTLGGLFNNMGTAERQATAAAKKVLPADKVGRESGSPLIKVAMDVLSGSSVFRGYPAHYKAAAINSFTQELEKIAYVGPEQLVGGIIGYHKGKEQKGRGEKHTFGGKQGASLLIPGGAGYQVGRYLGHKSEAEKTANARHAARSAATSVGKDVVTGAAGYAGYRAVKRIIDGPSSESTK